VQTGLVIRWLQEIGKTVDLVPWNTGRLLRELSSHQELADYNERIADKFRGQLSMVCKQCQEIEKMFDEENAIDDLESYHESGPNRSTRFLIEAIRSVGISGMTLLDIGGGIGAIQFELFEDDIRQSTTVEASSAYIQLGQKEAQRSGYGDRITYHHGDYTILADEINATDIITLDRVICCYPDMDKLVDISSSKAAKLYGAVFPRDTWWLKIAGIIALPFFRLFTRSAFTFYVHSNQEIDSIVRRNGLRLLFSRVSGIWKIVLYTRQNA